MFTTDTHFAGLQSGRTSRSNQLQPEIPTAPQQEYIQRIANRLSSIALCSPGWEASGMVAQQKAGARVVNL